MTTPQPPLRLARALLQAQLLSPDLQPLAAEALWGAFVQGLSAHARQHQLPHDSHGSFRHAARHLDRLRNTNFRSSSFAGAERLHVHFYHQPLSPSQLSEVSARTRNATALLTTLHGP